MIYMRNITITTAKSATYLENVGLSAYVLGPLAEIMRDFDWGDGSFSVTRDKLSTLYSQYPDVLGSYPALKAMAVNEETQFQ